MRTIMIATLLLYITGCGGNGNDTGQTPPPSPQTHDSAKTPPSVPVIE